MDEASTKSNDSNDCHLIRGKQIDTVSKHFGEKVIDEEGDCALEDEAYDEEIKLWLRSERSKEVLEQAKKFSPFPYTDDFRDPNASSYGGFQLTDSETTSKIRSAGTSIIGQAAKQAMWGYFKLSSLPFPVCGSTMKSEVQ